LAGLVQKLTTRSLILISLMIFFVSIMLATWISEKNNQQLIVEREEDFIREITAISAKQIYAIMIDDAVEFGSKFIESDRFKAFFQQAVISNNRSNLDDYLQDPFVNGYINAATLSMESLRIYDSEWKLVSSANSRQFKPQQDNEKSENPLINEAKKRSGPDKLKIISGRWSDKNGTYYSVLLPIGGFVVNGYLEVVVSAALNLPSIEIYIGYFVNILDNSTGELIFQGNKKNLRQTASEEAFHAVTYTIHTLDRQPAYEITVHVPITKFMKKIKANQQQTLITAALLSLLILGFILAFLEFLLIRPMERLRKDIHQQSITLTGEPVSTRGIREFHDLSSDFNHLIRIAKSKSDELYELTMVDELTRLPNRRALETFYETAEKDASRTNEAICVIMMDVDYFKKFNDTYGHQAGDDCLVGVADAIRRVIKRSTDLAGRYGGEEFTVVLPFTRLEGAIKIAEAILESVRSARILHKASDVADFVTVSLGIAVCEKAEKGCVKALIATADENLYQAKKSGRNRVYYQT
jgi:diguanylate cyclase (GGDEF)-like protein